MDSQRRFYRPARHFPVGAGYSRGQHIHIHRLSLTGNTGKHHHGFGNDTALFSHNPCHSPVFHNFKDNVYVERIFKGIRPAVVALIAAPTFSMAKSAKVNRYTIWIPVVSALLIWLLGFSPIWIIIAAGVGGYVFGKLRYPKVKS